MLSHKSHIQAQHHLCRLDKLTSTVHRTFLDIFMCLVLRHVISLHQNRLCLIYKLALLRISYSRLASLSPSAPILCLKHHVYGIHKIHHLYRHRYAHNVTWTLGQHPFGGKQKKVELWRKALLELKIQHIRQSIPRYDNSSAQRMCMLKRNDFDCKPWNLLYIASAYKTRELRKALPHWSSYTFIEEFRKLFNATIVFDDIRKTCSVINASELTTADSVEIEPLDEYTTDYDEDGSFSTSSTANLEYNLGDSANRDNYEVISKKVFESFEIVNSNELMGADRQFAATTLSWSERKKRQTIIENFGDYYIYVEDENEKKSWKLAGIWSPLIRDKSSDDYVDLNISPAAQVVENINFKSGFMEDNYYEKRCLLSIPNDKEPDSKECDIDEDGYSYTSVQDALNDESMLDTSEDEQECMNIFFVLPGRVQTGDGTSSTISWVGEKSRWPQFMTDYRINGGYRFSGIAFIDDAFYSLSLCTKSEIGTTCLGSLHDNGLKIDNKNSLQVKFKSEVIPDPSNTYIIHNKKYVCEKIELEVKDDQIEPIFVGYFYMMS